jgi:hypothetical protein
MRDYQIRGLNWMISLYENGINGILADEMVNRLLLLIVILEIVILSFHASPFWSYNIPANICSH